MALTKLQSFNIDPTANFTFANITAGNANLGNAATANYFIGNGSLLTGLSSSDSNYANFAGTIVNSSQPNITSVGTLSNLTSNGTVDFANTSNVTLGSVSNIRLSGGTNGQVLTSNGSSGLYWSAVATGGGGSNILNGTSNVSIDLSGGNINASVGGNANIVVISSTGVDIAGYANITGSANIQGNLKLTGNRNDLGPVSNLTIPGGLSGYVLSTDGSGNLSWTGQTGGGSGTSAIQEFVATEGQDTFTIVGGYNVGSVIVFVNGIQMNNIDYTATNGITVILTDSRKSSDIVRVLSSMVSPAINIRSIQSFSIAMSIALSM